MPETESPVPENGESVILGAIFDVDGTLLDSMYVWATIGERYLRGLGMEHSENLWKAFSSFTLRQSAQYYIDHYGEQQSQIPGYLRMPYMQQRPHQRRASRFWESGIPPKHARES